MKSSRIVSALTAVVVVASTLLLGACGSGDNSSAPLIGDVREVEVSFLNNPVWEDDGSTVMRISRKGSINEEEALISIPPNGRVTGQDTVTFPSGAQTLDVPLTLVDNTDVDGDIDVTITVTTGGTSGTGVLRIQDDENHLTLSLSEAVLDEEGGSTQLTVERLGKTIDLSAAMVVTLTQDPAGELNLPASVTISAGQAARTVTVTTIDDTVDDDDQTVTITGSTATLPDDAVQLTIIDNEEFIKIDLSEPAISEAGDTLTLTLRRPFVGSELTADITIDAPEVSPLPESVVFGANSPTVSLVLTAIDNDTEDGLRTRVISVDAPGFPIVTAELDIIDDDNNDVFDQFNTIRGVIEDEGQPVAGAQVMLLYKDEEVDRQSTDAEGVFAFVDRWGPLEHYSVRVP